MTKKERSLSNYMNYTNQLCRDDVIIILEDLEFAWKKDDVKKVIKLWKRGDSIQSIAKEIGRDGDELFMLLLHLARQDKIKKRKGYIWGKL